MSNTVRGIFAILEPDAWSEDLENAISMLRGVADARVTELDASAMAPAADRPPMQPITFDEEGVARFKPNAIVRHLLDHGKIDMNALALLPFSREDREQFAQLIGYSVSGFGDLSYASAEACEIAVRKVDELRAKAPGSGG